jgi:hypothetical protein
LFAGLETHFVLQILQSMAFGVSQLHECGLTHNQLSTKFFKVFFCRFLYVFFCIYVILNLPLKHHQTYSEFHQITLHKPWTDFPNHGVERAAPAGQACRAQERVSRLFFQQ